MKYLQTATLFLFCFLSFLAIPSLSIAKDSLPSKNCSIINTSNVDCNTGNSLEEKELNDEALIQSMKNALYQIYDEKKVKFGTFNVEKSNNEITVTGNGELYKEAITLSSTFTTGEKLLSISGLSLIHI